MTITDKELREWKKIPITLSVHESLRLITELEKVRGLLESTADCILDGLPCWCYDHRVDCGSGHSTYCSELRSYLKEAKGE